MKKIMLIGQTGSGKAALVHALTEGGYTSRKAMAVDYCGPFINTPGEFLENRRFYFALITTAADCDILFMMQNATHDTSLFPPQFATIFNRTVFGVVSHADTPAANIERAKRYLQSAGARSMLCLDAATGKGLDEVRALLAS